MSDMGSALAAAPSGMVFTPVCVPYLRSEYGKEYDFDAPVKLLDKMMHTMADHATQQVVVLGQVLASDITIGYEDIVNTQVLALFLVSICWPRGMLRMGRAEGIAGWQLMRAVALSRECMESFSYFFLVLLLFI